MRAGRPVLWLLAPVVMGLSVLTAPGSAGADAVAGSITITQPNGATPRDSGGSASDYGVALPPGASCPGDTAHQGYRVDSFLVPEGVSPAAVRFKTGLPSTGYGLIAYGAYYGAINTAENTGQIVGVPPQFTWSRLTPRDLFPDHQTASTWLAGLACADTHGVVTDYWASRVRFTASASDPGGFTWKVLAQPAASSSHHRLWLGIGLLVVAGLLGTVAVVLSIRRRPGGPPPTGRAPSPVASSPAPVRAPAPDGTAPALPSGSDDAAHRDSRQATRAGR